MYENKILMEDIEYIHKKLSENEIKKLENSTLLITGCAGFLGYYFLHYFVNYAEELGLKRIIGLDNFMIREPLWLKQLEDKCEIFEIYKFDIISSDINEILDSDKVDIVIHMASIASPTFYRKYPIETLDANIWGMRRLFDFYKNKKLKGFLFFSSSEIYGDPDKENIPTDEEYYGNVSCIGPRACYDESKRFGETMCYLFSQQYNIPIRIARPFNNFGPGMSLEDKRVPADFAKAVFEGNDIEIFSDGTPTRTFCYISDAIAGYLKVLLYTKFDYFNIGQDSPEINMIDLAKIYADKSKKIFNTEVKVLFAPAPEKDYLTNNPNRRCPKIDKASKLLNYKPEISVEEGVERFLKFIKYNKGIL